MAILGEASDKALWVRPVEEITRLHQEVQNLGRLLFEKAVRIGEILTQIKGALRHGEWLPWLKDHVPFDQKSAWNYMGCFDHQVEIRAKLGNNPNLTAAYRMIGSNSSNGSEPQRLHEPNFHSQAVRLEQNLVGLFTHYLQRRPLKSWHTEEIYDLLCSLKPLSEVVAQLENELGTRNDLPASYRSQNAN